MHSWLYGDQFIIHSFRGITPAYSNGHVSVYRLRDLRQSCDHASLRPPYISRLAASSWVAPGHRSAIVSWHDSEAIDSGLFAYLESLFADWNSFVHLYQSGGQLVMQSSRAAEANINDVLAANQVIYLAYPAANADIESLSSHLPLDRFHLCQRTQFDDGSVIERYISLDFDCGPGSLSAPISVEYENGIRLEITTFNATDEALDVQYAWSSLPPAAHAVSLQVVDGAGNRALGGDMVIGDVSLARQSLDITDLPPGEYSVKLIVYNFSTGSSVPGSVTQSGDAFARALEVGAVLRE